MPGQRLDKWLWCARLTKTRTGAARLIEAGKVRINGDRTLKASRLVQTGDVLTAAFIGRLSVVRVLGASERRGPASLARTLYEDLTPPAPPRAETDGRQGPRPTKRDRRRLEALRGGDF
ncbi:MAG: RNA-binding S4 domain-containing protein [Methyloceanibacter sp.]